MRKTASFIAITGLVVALASCASGGSGGGGGKSSGDAGYGQQKAVYHFNKANCKKTNGGLRNIGNHFKALSNDATKLQISAVFHGGGVSTLFKEAGTTTTKKGKVLKVGCNPKLTKSIQSKIATLKNMGVRFNVCKNTLVGRQIKLDRLYDVSKDDIVPSGVAELSSLQQKGFKYIKP